jgi:hypothetical protein
MQPLALGAVSTPPSGAPRKWGRKRRNKMRKVIELYVLRYGLLDSLTEIGHGIANAYDSYEGQKAFSEEGQRQLKNITTEIFHLRNKLAKETSDGA